MLQMCVQVDSRLLLYNISFTRCILIRARQWERRGGKLQSLDVPTLDGIKSLGLPLCISCPVRSTQKYQAFFLVTYGGWVLGEGRR